MSNESFGSGAWERPTRPARPTQPPSKPPGATLGKTWQDVRKELYTLEEIAESDRRVAFEIWFDNLGDYRSKGEYPCTLCSYGNSCYCPAANWTEPEFNMLKCRETLFQSFILANWSAYEVANDE